MEALNIIFAFCVLNNDDDYDDAADEPVVEVVLVVDRVRRRRRSDEQIKVELKANTKKFHIEAPTIRPRKEKIKLVAADDGFLLCLFS